MIQVAADTRNRLARRVKAGLTGAALALAITATVYCVLRFEPSGLEEAPVRGIAYESTLMGWSRTVLDTPYGPMPLGERFRPGDDVVIALRRGRWTRLPSVSWEKSAPEYEFELAASALRKTLAEPLPEIALPPECTAGQVREGNRCCMTESGACGWDSECCSGLKCIRPWLVCAPR